MNDNFQNPTQKKPRMEQDISEHTENTAEKTSSSHAAPKAMPIKPGIYLVSTPIGNLRDITFRALDVLSSVDLIVCEDTRVTGKLIGAYGFKKKMQVYNDHSTQKQREDIINLVKNGQSVAFLSDAGTPLVSDPGFKLVRFAIENNIMVTSLPGPNAALTALQLSGLPSDQFSFLGFLPPKSGARQSVLQQWAETPSTLLIYETGPRLLASLGDMRTVFGDRDVAVMREMTKIYEETRRGKLSELIAHYKKEGAPKGEIVIAVNKSQGEAVSSESIEDQLKKALETMSVRDAAEMVATATGKPKKAIYTLALKLSC